MRRQEQREKTPLSSFWMVSQIRIIWARFSERRNAGAHGVIIPKRRSVGLNATVGKTSAGAIEYMPVAKVTNLVKTMEQLKKEGLWFACADMGENDHFDTNLKGPIGLVIGSEGEGVSRLVKENCDFTASIPMYGKISSLNASVAAALLMYEVVRQRNYSK